MKDNKEVITEFNEYVNMTASELEKWLESDASNGAGVFKNGGHDGGKSVGQESGTRIVEILRSNPDKDRDKYTDEQLQHMRKVVSYCKRHLAQEAGGNKEKDPEDVKQTKSFISLKNWGHDFLKGEGKGSGSSSSGQGDASMNKEDEEDGEEDKEAAELQADDKNQKTDTQNGKQNGNDHAGNAAHEQKEEDDVDEAEGEKADENEDNDQEQSGSKDKKNSQQMVEQNGDDTAHQQRQNEDDEDEENKDKRAGDKRKNPGNQNRSHKKRETGNLTRPSTENDESENEDRVSEEVEKQEEQDDTPEGSEDGDSAEKASKKGPKKGQTASWKWGNGNPQGKVLDVKEDKYDFRNSNNLLLPMVLCFPGHLTNNYIYLTGRPLQRSVATKSLATATQRILL